jgi:uncharacterized protein (DUF58 family)
MGMLLGGLLSLLYFVSLQSQAGLLFLLLGVVFGCYVINFFGARQSVSSADLSRLTTIKTVENRKTAVPVEIRNKSPKPIGMISVMSEFGQLFRIAQILPKSTVHLSPELTLPIRGVYKLSGFKLTSTFPFGLVKSSHNINQDGDIIVCPAIYPAPCPKAAGFEPMVGGAYTGNHKSSTGNDFAGVRPYQPHDSVKSIHWKSSSKGQGVMVKEFNEELSGRISFVLDCDKGIRYNGEVELDRAVRAAGSMIFSALDHDHHVELIDLNQLTLMHNPAFMDGDFVLEALAKLQDKKYCLTYGNLKKAYEQISKKGAICLVLTVVNDDLLEFINFLLQEKRVVSVCLPEHIQDVEFPIGVTLFHYGKNKIN